MPAPLPALLLALAAGVLLLWLFDRLAPAQAARLGMALERRRSRVRVRHTRVAGFALPYLEGGSGTPLVLIHGFGGDKDNFVRIARFLTPHYRLLCPDLPGFGAASRDAGASYTIADQVERLRAWLDAVAPGPVHLGGNSMGGFIAAQFAATYPQRVVSLWLLDAAGTAAAQDSAVLRHYRASGQMPLLVRREADFAALLRSASARPPFLPFSVRTMLARRAVADFALHSRIMRELTSAPLLEQQFAPQALPALIVWGERDQILDPAGAVTLQRLFPRGQQVLMAGIGHLPMLEAPRQSARDYLAFRRTLAP